MLFIMGREEVGKTDSNAFTRVDGGRSIRKAHYGGRVFNSVWPGVFVCGWMSSNVRDNPTADIVGRSGAP